LTNRTYFLPDPTALETPLLPTNIVIALDEKNKACLVRHEGMGGIKGQTGEKILGQAWGAAEERIKEIRRILEESSG
jgi:exosome complex component RRP43